MSNVLFVSVYHDCEIFNNIIDEMCLLFLSGELNIMNDNFKYVFRPKRKQD